MWAEIKFKKNFVHYTSYIYLNLGTKEMAGEVVNSAKTYETLMKRTRASFSCLAFSSSW